MTLSETPPEGLLDWIKAPGSPMAGLFHLPRRLADGSADGAAAQVCGCRMLGLR